MEDFKEDFKINAFRKFTKDIEIKLVKILSQTKGNSKLDEFRKYLTYSVNELRKLDKKILKQQQLKEINKNNKNKQKEWLDKIKEGMKNIKT